MEKYLEQFLLIVSNWPPSNPYTSLGLVFGSLAAFLGIYILHQSTQQAEQLVVEAMKILKNKVRASINTQAKYLPETAVRALANDVQKSLQCPTITDDMVKETIRQLILEEEDELRSGHLAFSPTQATSNAPIQILSSALRPFEPGALPLMSIASVNPTLAYFLSALLVSVVILATQFYVALIWDDSLAITGIVGLTVLQFLQIYAHARAYKFWKKRYAEAKANRFSELLFARKTVFHPVFDFFISKTVTMDLNLIAVKWAPLWEGLFPIAGCYVLPLFVTLLTKSISDWMNMDIADIRPVLLIGLVASILVGFFGNTWLFASFHEYKFFEVGKLKKKMDGLSRHYLLVKIGRDTPQKNQLAEYVSVCRQLWAITGHDFYKKRAEEVQDWIGV